jgi:hypothetical protein
VASIKDFVKSTDVLLVFGHSLPPFSLFKFPFLAKDNDPFGERFNLRGSAVVPKIEHKGRIDFAGKFPVTGAERSDYLGHSASYAKDVVS